MKSRDGKSQRREEKKKEDPGARKWLAFYSSKEVS